MLPVFLERSGDRTFFASGPKPELSEGPSCRVLKRFTLRNTPSGGRCSRTGRIVARGIGPNIIGKYETTRRWGVGKSVSFFEFNVALVSSWKALGKHNRVHSLLKLPKGILTIEPSQVGDYLGEFFIPSWYHEVLGSPRVLSSTINSRIGDLTSGTIVRQVNISNSFQIATALKSLAFVVLSIFDLTLVIAPSGSPIFLGDKTRVINHEVNKDRVFIEQWAQQLNRKGARSMRYRSRRPIVRGVVRNPNDHPHGGRTKTVSYPQTPWAKVVLKSKQKS